MSGGLPLISSVSGELATAIERYGFGLNFEAGSSKQLADRILTLFSNNDMLKDMAQNSLSFFKEYLDSENTYNKYAEHVEHVAKSRSNVAI